MTEDLGGNSGPLLLVVDDDELVRRTLVRMLHAEGFRILAAGSAEEAVELAERHGSAIDGVILDATLPALSGSDAVRAISSRLPAARLVVVTGGGMERQGFLVRLPGVHAVLAKPFRSADILAPFAGLRPS